MLLIRTRPQASSKGRDQQRISHNDRIGLVAGQVGTAAFGACGGSFLAQRLRGLLGLLTLDTFSLRVRFDFLVEEVRVDGCHVRRVDVDERGGALGFIVVDAADAGGAAVVPVLGLFSRMFVLYGWTYAWDEISTGFEGI